MPFKAPTEQHGRADLHVKSFVRILSLNFFAIHFTFDFTDATTGGTNDWAKGVVGVKHAICPELRGRDFVIDKSEIQLSFEEIWAGIVAQEAALTQ